MASFPAQTNSGQIDATRWSSPRAPWTRLGPGPEAPPAEDDVARVEVYPQGVTRRPGYGTHAHGLILVFMRTE